REATVVADFGRAGARAILAICRSGLWLLPELTNREAPASQQVDIFLLPFGSAQPQRFAVGRYRCAVDFVRAFDRAGDFERREIQNQDTARADCVRLGGVAREK